MTASQTILPGCAPVSTASHAALEQDLHGEVAVCLAALFSWAEFHGGRTALIDGTISRFICAGRPHDHGIDRAIEHTRRALTRHLERNNAAPAWLPQSIITLITADNSAG
jgi:hypothetical protein